MNNNTCTNDLDDNFSALTIESKEMPQELTQEEFQLLNWELSLVNYNSDEDSDYYPSEDEDEMYSDNSGSDEDEILDMID